MSNEDTQRAAHSAVDMAKLGLEAYYNALNQRVISLLANDRASFVQTLEDIHTMIAAVAQQQADNHREAKQDSGEVLAGVQGTVVQLARVETELAEAVRGLGKLSETVDSAVVRLERVEDSQQRLVGQVQDVDERVDQMGQDVRGLVERVDKMESGMHAVEQRVGRLEATLLLMSEENAAAAAAIMLLQEFREANPPADIVQRLMQAAERRAG